MNKRTAYLAWTLEDGEANAEECFGAGWDAAKADDADLLAELLTACEAEIHWCDVQAGGYARRQQIAHLRRLVAKARGTEATP